MEGIDRYVPKMVIREKKKNERFNRCELARLLFARVLHNAQRQNLYRSRRGKKLHVFST